MKVFLLAFSIFAAMVLQCALSQQAVAQVGSDCQVRVGNGCVEGGANVPCAGWYDCISPGPDLIDCLVKTFLCHPDSPPPTACKRGTAQCGGKPVKLEDGDVYIKQTDINIPGLGGGLNLTRTWNSIWPSSESAYQIGLFGPNWKSNFEERVYVGADHYIKYARGDGGVWSFGWNVNGSVWSVASPANESVTLVEGPSDWTMTFKDGEQRLFDNNSGNLVEIIDRNGNTTTLSYDSLGRLATVAGPASRHLYFTYGSGTYLVSAITSDFGESVSYSYDSAGRLTQVTEPDGSTLSFQYDGNSNISAVLDSQGKVLESHTYDSSGRGLSSAEANGVNAVTLSYPN